MDGGQQKINPNLRSLDYSTSGGIVAPELGLKEANTSVHQNRRGASGRQKRTGTSNSRGGNQQIETAPSADKEDMVNMLDISQEQI